MSQERSVRDVSGLYKAVIGGADGIRTHDLLDAIEARSQLRHGPTDISRVYHRNLSSTSTCFPCNPGRALQVLLSEAKSKQSVSQDATKDEPPRSFPTSPP